MSHYRAPPAVLPSLRDLEVEEATAPRGTGAGWGVEMFCFLSAREPFVVGELREERRARVRGASAPCPAFVVDPAAVLPPARKVFQYVLPPPKTLSAGRPVFV